MTTEQHTALLVMDMQDGILQHYPDRARLVHNLQRCISKAREKGIPVFYVTLSFRKNMPEISENSKNFTLLKERLANADLEAFSKVDAEIAPQEDDILITKKRVSAFTGSDLELVLRGKSIRHIILTGVATSGVVLSTLREAADKDYRITVLSDCCGDSDEEVHRVLTTKVFPRQAEVLREEEWA